MKKNRYFLVSYAAYMEGGNQFLGLSSVITEGTFINKQRFSNDIRKEADENGQTLKSVLITQLLELNEQDYLDWYE